LCVAGKCFGPGPGPSPGVDTPEKRQLTKQRIFGELCPGNFVPCTVGQGGYEVSVCRIATRAPSLKSRLECVDIQTDIESCGGCIGEPDAGNGRSSGIVCTTWPQVESVSCVDGECVIGKSPLSLSLCSNLVEGSQLLPSISSSAQSLSDLPCDHEHVEACALDALLRKTGLASLTANGDLAWIKAATKG
jgi:hypothetical protein